MKRRNKSRVEREFRKRDRELLRKLKEKGGQEPTANLRKIPLEKTNQISEMK